MNDFYDWLFDGTTLIIQYFDIYEKNDYFIDKNKWKKYTDLMNIPLWEIITDKIKKEFKDEWEEFKTHIKEE